MKIRKNKLTIENIDFGYKKRDDGQNDNSSHVPHNGSKSGKFGQFFL